MIASNSVETIGCEHCGNQHFAYEECPRLADEWYANDFDPASSSNSPIEPTNEGDQVSH